MSRVVGLRDRLRPRRALSGGVAALVAVPLTLVLARADGLPGSRVELSGGGAWLASPSQGLVTLVDGASERVVGSVRAPGAQAGGDLSAVQAGTAAYIVNPTTGTVSRVDGATYAVSKPVQFGQPGGSLNVLAGGTGVYIVDGTRRLAAAADPATLRVRQQLSLAARPGPGQSAVDADGRLWVVDSDGGGLTWFAGGKHVRADGADAQARLVLVGGQPVLVDLARQRLGRLADSGTVPSWSCVDVRAGDQVELLGSALSPRVYAAVSGSGTLVAAGVDHDDCDLGVTVGEPGDKFGPLVESAGFVLVPNQTSGRTVVVDLATREVAADLEVVKPGARLELVAKDGLVFYNDLDGDRAGVIRFDGRQWQLGRSLRKYNRSRSGEGILTPSGAKPEQQQPEQRGQQPGRGQDPNRPDPNRPDPGSDPGADDPTDPGSGPAGTGQQPPAAPPSGVPTPAPPGPPPRPVIRSLTWNPDVVVRELEVEFRATVENAQGATWRWQILDPAAGNAILRDDPSVGSYRVTLPAGTPANLLIRLDVSTEGGQAIPMTRPFTTTSSLAPQIDSLSASDADAGISQPLTFTAVESVAGDRGTWTWTVDGPGGPAGPIDGTAGAALDRAFDTAGEYTVTLRVEYDTASDEASVAVTVSDQARLVAVTGSPIELRNGTSPSVQARLEGSFVTQRVGVRVDSWLRASDAGGQNVEPGGTVSFLINANGEPPNDGLNPDAIEFSLDNGSRVTFDALGNRPPTWNNYAVCLSVDASQAQFLADFNDGDVASLDVTLHAGGLSRQMEFVDGGPSGHGQFWSLFVQKADLPNVSTWSVDAVDAFGAESDVGTADRDTCW